MSKSSARTASRGQVDAPTEHDNHDTAASYADAASEITLDGATRAKFVLFAIPVAERVADGPVMRGFLETPAGKISMAGWKKIARDSGNEYLSLKVGNTKRREEGAAADTPEEWLLGPFYGRLFKETTISRGEKRTRYFGFIEDSVKTGEERSGKGIYKTNWQIQVRAKPDVSGDGRTHYINGSAYPRDFTPAVADNHLPF